MDTKKGLIILIALLLAIPLVFAADTTQLYTRISMKPFYNTTLAKNIPYFFNLSVNPPDKITQVYSAIVKFDIYVTSSPQDFNLTVNNQSCLNPIFQGTSSGFATIQFDCSNIINKSGNYSLRLFSIKDAGSAVGYLDLTYTNKPLATMELSGTEYKAGDDGTIFLFLKDPNGIPIANATCTLDIYLPLSANSTHDEWINDGLMRYLEEGLYYYDFIAPLFDGIYMVNAQCTYVTSNNQYYTLSSGLSPTRNATYGTYTGDPFVLNDYSEWLYTQCDSGTVGGGSKACDSWYQWNLSAGGLTGNVTQFFVQYLGECNGANPLTQYWWNWSNSQWVKLPNNLTFSSTASSGVPIGVDEYLSNSIPLQAISNTTLVRIRTLTTSGSTFKLWSNMLVLKAVQYGTTIQDLKGSGEIHVSGGAVGENNYFRVDTCDGYMDGRCGIFTNDDEFDLIEGEIEDWFNLSASSTRADVSIHYETPFSVDCTGIYWIKQWNGTAWVDFTDYITYSQPSFQNCIITLNQDMISGTAYEYRIKMDNYMKWEVQYSEQIYKTLHTLIQPLCADRNFTYTTPITESTPLSNDTITEFCHRTYDDFYWISSYYNQSLDVDIAGEYASYVQEMRFYRQELFNRYDLLSKALDNSSQVIISMLGNLTNMTFGNLTDMNNKLLNITGELAIHKSMIQSIIDYLTNTIYPYLQQIWNKLLGLEAQLNTTINITNQTLHIANLTKNDTAMILTRIHEMNVTIINATGIYINNSANIVIDNITGLIETSLIANLKFIGGTEYIPSQQGKAVVQFLDRNGNTIDNLSPQIRIFNPNLSLFLNWTSMTNIADGIYYINFSAPSTTGVFIVDAYVTYQAKTYYNSHTFHVSEPQNTSIIAAINSTNALIGSVNTNLSQMIVSLNTNSSQNFNYTWALLLAINNSIQAQQNNSEILAYLISIQNIVNTTQQNLANINGSLSQQLTEINKSITNLTQITIQINGSVTQINSTTTDINNTVTLINETVEWIKQHLNITINETEGNMHLEVTAPALCLLDTNWVALARVSDEYGVTLGPGDNVECNMTTDLWGTDPMNFDYAKAKYKYIHVCDPDYTTFNWSVNCAR